MRFKTDENLHPDVALFLRTEGHDALTVWDQGLRGRRDPDIAEACRSEGRALITLDVGFADIRVYPPQDFSGLIVLRLGQQSCLHVLHVLPQVIALLKRERLTGQLWIVDEKAVRVREG